MTYTVHVSKRGGEELEFKGIRFFLAEPGRMKMLREQWITITDVVGWIIHEEAE